MSGSEHASPTPQMTQSDESPEHTAPKTSSSAKAAMTVLSFLVFGAAILVAWSVGEGGQLGTGQPCWLLRTGNFRTAACSVNSLPASRHRGFLILVRAAGPANRISLPAKKTRLVSRLAQTGSGGHEGLLQVPSYLPRLKTRSSGTLEDAEAGSPSQASSARFGWQTLIWKNASCG